MTAEREDGNAMIEFVWLAVLLLIPFVYALLAVFAVQRGAFGVTQAAREAGRAIATADNVHDGLAQANAAIVLALGDQHVGGDPELSVVPAGASCSDKGITPTLAAGSRFTVCVAVDMPLPFTNTGFAKLTQIHVSASTLVTVDSYRSAP